MISLLQRYKSILLWFMTGLVVAVLLSLGLASEQPANAYQPTSGSVYIDSSFAASHLEPNFYQ